MSFFKNKYENKWDKYKTKYKELQHNIENHFDVMLEELSSDIQKLQEISYKLKQFKNKINLLELNEPIKFQNDEGSNVIVYHVDKQSNPFKLGENENANNKALELFKKRDNSLI